MVVSSSQRRPVTLRAKVLVIGDACTGKSSLMSMLSSDGTHFPKQYNMTVSCDHSLKSYLIPETADTVEMYFFDSSGKECLFDRVVTQWNSPSAVIAVFDLSNPVSLHSVSKWMERAKKLTPTDTTLPAVLIGNKADLDNELLNTAERQSEIEGICRQYGMKFFPVSAKEGEGGVEEPVKHLAQVYHDSFMARVISLGGGS